jgi:hypothetical protein
MIFHTLEKMWKNIAIAQKQQAVTPKHNYAQNTVL